MSNAAAINRSKSTIETELRFLAESNMLNPNQLQSIMAQLPQNGQPAQYTDYGDEKPRWQGQDQQPPSIQHIAQASQDPSHPANPQNPKHHEWLNNLGSKFGNAVVWGGGATLGSDLMNDAVHKIGL